jgi:hypothetical protein
LVLLLLNNLTASLSILHVYVKLSHNWQTMRCDIVMLDKMDIRVTLQHWMHCSVF